MKLGFGLYRHQLTDDNFRFARQCGATDLVVHLVDYFGGGAVRDHQPVGDDGWGWAGDPEDPIWGYDSLARLQETAGRHGLTVWAIENFDPALWYDILLNGPGRDRQMARLQTLIRDVGRAGIRAFGYNFSIAGVAGRKSGPLARGGAETVYVDGPDERPIPPGMVWNMRYAPGGSGHLAFFPHDELWQRLEWFLRHLVPAAEEADVRLAAHPDDPPFPVLRNAPRLVYQPQMYRRLLELYPSRCNALEFCLGTLAEMTGGDIYAATEEFARGGNIAYVHFRNVRGKIPAYQETFPDEGDIDMLRIVRILRNCGYDGPLIPDHTPLMTCEAPWHAGMAYAMGYMQGLLRCVRDDGAASMRVVGRL